jgi:hypothetical protein
VGRPPILGDGSSPAASASAALRLAIERFNFAPFRPKRLPHVQVSFRITEKQRRIFKREAQLKDASLGELIRAGM